MGIEKGNQSSDFDCSFSKLKDGGRGSLGIAQLVTALRLIGFDQLFYDGSGLPS